MTLLQLDPDNILYFCKTPMTASPSRMLKLTNMHSGNVAFKVKTTAPKAYLVRPSNGTLRPRDTQEVQIILQPQGSDGQANNHRFLVQATPVNTFDPVSREQWAEFSKDIVQEMRLNVVLEESETMEAETATTKQSESTFAANPAHQVSNATGEQAGDLKVKYDELVQYTLMLEKEKKKLEADMANLTAAKGSGGGDGGGYSMMQIIAVAIIAFLLSFAAKFVS